MPTWYQTENKTLYTKSQQTLHGKRVSILIGFKCHLCHVSVYLTDQNMLQSGNPMKLNFEGLQMYKWNTSMDKVQRVDEKNGFICQNN